MPATARFAGTDGPRHLRFGAHAWAEKARAALETDLARAITGEVRFDGGTRAMYAAGGSNYRQVPIGVVMPRSIEDIVRAVEVCRRHGAPVLGRGGGTSLAGQCCNIAVVFDCSKYVNRLVSLDPDARRARGARRDPLPPHSRRGERPRH